MSAPTSEKTTKKTPTARFSLDSNRPMDYSEEKGADTSYPRHPSRASSLSSLDKLKLKHTKRGSKLKDGSEKKRKDTLTKENTNSNGSLNDANNRDTSPSANDIERISSEQPGSLAAVCQYGLANEKQNNLFHALFKSVPQTDMLIEVYKCALHKEILLQGHVYISEHHVCFKSNIFGWVTNLVISFDEITAVEKRMTARVIPNGITIDTPTSKHVFASFLSRDQAYERIVNIWKIHKRMSSLVLSSSTISSEDLSSSAENSLEDSKELISLSDHSSLHSHDSAIAPSTPPLLLTDENMLKEDVSPQPPTIPLENKSTASTLLKIKDIPLVFNNRPRSVSDSYAIKARCPPVANSSNQNSSLEKSYMSLTNKIQIGKIVKCPCMKHSEQHSYVALDRIYPGSVEAMDKLFYQTNFIRNFLECCENFEDVQLEKWKNNSRNINGKRKIKAAEGRKKIITTLFHEKREHFNPPYYSCVTSNKSMPDMPMGAIYYIQSRTCITRVSQQRVRVLVTFDVKFKKSGLVSSVIENNAADDQFRQYSHLASVLDTPRLAKELIKDEELLLVLRLKPKHYLKTASDWMKFQTYPILQTLTFLTLLLVVVSQVILAVRVTSINNTFDTIQKELKQQNTYEEMLIYSSN